MKSKKICIVTPCDTTFTTFSLRDFNCIKGIQVSQGVTVGTEYVISDAPPSPVQRTRRTEGTLKSSLIGEQWLVTQLKNHFQGSGDIKKV